MGKILELAEALWSGEKDIYEYHPFGLPQGIEKIADNTWFYRGFSNSIIRETTDGLIIIDPSSAWDAKKRFKAVRSVSSQRAGTIIWTHGHVDHVFGVDEYVKEAEKKEWPKPKVIAHELVPERFKRYAETAGWNGYINLRQFRGGKGTSVFPGEFYNPDIIYSDHYPFEQGNITVKLYHDRGETDDSTWIFFPDTRVLCTGDLFIWGVPNCGNPQKVQRYAMEWAIALRKMVDLNPNVLAPGHGVPIVGEDRVRQALEDTAALLESLHDQTIELMNQGASLDRILKEVKAPAELLEKPYLKPVYDEPEFIVRNIWRLHGGWFEGGLGANLKPSSERERAQEIANLSGGAKKLADRAEELLSEGNFKLACHLAEWAYLCLPEDPKIRKIASNVFIARAKNESSTMAIGIFQSGARKMGGLPEKGHLEQIQF
ncbi:MAG: alkyl sulfatase dimerization domain-containing protein [Promethearchaeota archaeon]